MRAEQIAQLGDPESRDSERRKRGATPDAAIAAGRRVEFAGSVEQREQLVDLKECPGGLHGRQEAVLALADLHRVALDVAVVLGPLHDLAEQREHRVDRSVATAHACDACRASRPVRLDRLDQRLAASRGLSDHARAVGKLVAKFVDPGDIDLEQLKAPEVPDQIAEPPLEVGDRVLVKAVALLRLDDLPREGPEQLVTVGPRLGVGKTEVLFSGGTHVPRSTCCRIDSNSISARVSFQPCVLVPNTSRWRRP